MTSAEITDGPSPPIDAAAGEGRSTSSNHSYRQILSSTAIIGGSSAANILFSIVRAKSLAILLGPAGVGLFGLYQIVIDLSQTIAGLGVPASGVRQIAEAAGRGDEDVMATTATALRRACLILGVVGALALVALSYPIATLTFGSPIHVTAIAFLSIVLFLRMVSAGQIALVQGVRRIGDLARFNIISGFASMIISIPIVYAFGTDGIVPSLICVAVVSIAASWWFRRKIVIPKVQLSLRATLTQTSPLLALGFVFMASALFDVGSAYAIRIIVLRHEGVDAAGLYQAAWAIGGLYAGFILHAMGTDFYPRLTAVAHDHETCNRTVNEQTEISILLAGPGVLATLTLAPVIIHVFYTAEFYPAIDLLRWISLGVLLRILAWPMGFIIIAKGARRAFFVADAAAALVHVALAWMLVPRFGVLGAGMAFFGCYVWHTAFVAAVSWHLTGFRWSAQNLKYACSYMAAALIVFALVSFADSWLAIGFGLMASGVGGIYTLRRLLVVLPKESLPVRLRPWHGTLARLVLL